VRLPVFVVTTDALGHDEIELAGDEGRHAVTVKRLRTGERLVVTDGLGTGAVCVVRATGRHSTLVDVEDRLVEPAPQPRLVVVQAIPKGEHGERAVDLLTEVGADVIVPWAASRNVVTWRGDRESKALARWRSTAHAAAKQARRLRFPEITEVRRTDQVRALVGDAALALVLHEDASLPIAEVDVPLSGDVVLVVGPEGGITDDELSAMEMEGARAVRMGPTVLRSSSAGLAAAATLLSRTPRWP